MEQVADRPLLNAILVEAAKISPEERRARIAGCIAAGRHNPDTLPFCIAPSDRELVRYCDQCWSIVDLHGLTWSWAPQQP